MHINITRVASHEYPKARYYVYVDGYGEKYFLTREEAEKYRDQRKAELENLTIITNNADRARQYTIGRFEFDGRIFEIDWRRMEENGRVVACEVVACVFFNGIQVGSFANPRIGVARWRSKIEVMRDASHYIKTRETWPWEQDDPALEIF